MPTAEYSLGKAVFTPFNRPVWNLEYISWFYLCSERTVQINFRVFVLSKCFNSEQAVGQGNSSRVCIELNTSFSRYMPVSVYSTNWALTRYHFLCCRWGLTWKKLWPRSAFSLPQRIMYLHSRIHGDFGDKISSYSFIISRSFFLSSITRVKFHHPCYSLVAWFCWIHNHKQVLLYLWD